METEKWERAIFSWDIKAAFNALPMFEFPKEDALFVGPAKKRVTFERLVVFSDLGERSAAILLFFTTNFAFKQNDESEDSNRNALRGILGSNAGEFFVAEYRKVYGTWDLANGKHMMNNYPMSKLVFKFAEHENFNDVAIVIAKQILNILRVNDGERTLASFKVFEDTLLKIKGESEWMTLNRFYTKKFGFPIIESNDDSDVQFSPELMLS